MVTSLRRWGPWAAKLVLSIAIVWYLLHRLDFAATWQQIRLIKPVWFLAALAMQSLQIPIAGLRWWVVVRATGGEVSAWRCTVIFYVSSFINLIVPGAVGGDAFRAWKLRRDGLDLTHAISSVLLERVATVAALFLTVAATEPILAARIGTVPGAGIFRALAVLGLLGILVLTALDRLPRGFYRLPVLRGFVAFAEDARQTFLRPKRALAVTFWSVLGHVNLAAVAWLLASGLQLPVSLLDCVVLIPPIILLTTLPISIAGWGVREGAAIAAFALIGVPAQSALALSILFGLVTTLVSLPGGPVWLTSPDRRLVETDDVASPLNQPPPDQLESSQPVSGGITPRGES